MRCILVSLCASAGLLACAKGAPSVPAPSPREVTAAERLVLAQVEAYNRRDINAFAETYAADAAFYTLPDGLDGKGQEFLRRAYGQVFASRPNLHAEVRGRLISGNYVILEEHVTGLGRRDTLKSVVVYEVKDGKISRVWFLP